MSSQKSDRSGRRLSRNERELWASFTRPIRPLRPQSAVPSEEAPKPSPPPDVVLGAAPAKARENSIPPLTSLDRRLRQRLARGRAGIDARIDLHGFTQAEAHGALVRFLRTSRAEGARVVLVITGKGMRGAAEDQGVLRRQVPHWLRSPNLRETVLGFETAGPKHGGEGAFYVRLRRARG